MLGGAVQRCLHSTSVMNRFTQQRRYPLSERPTVMLDCGSVSVVSGAVATLIDRSGNGRDFAQSTAANRPTYTASDANFSGQPTMTFDGVNDALTRSTAYAGGTTRTVYSCVRPTAAVADSRIYSDQTGAVASNSFIATDATPYLYASYNNPVGTLTTKRQAISTNTVYRTATVIDPAVGSAAVPAYYLNGTSTGSYSATAASNGSSLASGTHGVGSVANGLASFFTGQIAAVIDCASTHSTGQIANVNEYLRARYQRI